VTTVKGRVFARGGHIPFLFPFFGSSRRRGDLRAFGKEIIAAARNSFGRVAAR